MISRPGFEEWFDKGILVDAKGNPTVFYHGTDSDVNFNVFSRCGDFSIGFHFGDLAAAQSRLDSINCSPDVEWIGAIIPTVCNARSPLRLRDHHCWESYGVARELIDLGIISQAAFDYIVDGHSEYAMFAAMEIAGYDCVVYENQTEHGGKPTDSLMVWRSEMIKSPYTPRFVLGDPSISVGSPSDPSDIAAWEQIAQEIESHKVELGRLAISDLTELGFRGMTP